jgi:hypothetical protein
VQGGQSSARSLRVQSQQLPTESQVFEDEVHPATERTDQPAEEVSERHDHGKNFSGKDRIKLCAKSFISQVYDLLARHTPSQKRLPLIEIRCGPSQFQEQSARAMNICENIGIRISQLLCHESRCGFEVPQAFRLAPDEMSGKILRDN